MAQYVYGKLISNGKIIKIDDIPDELKERKHFSCVCPQCGAEFVARKGKQRENHFAHKADAPTGCTAEGANETALHLMAKQIIEDEIKNGSGCIELPAVYVYRSEMNLGDVPEHIMRRIPDRKEYKKAYTCYGKKVWVEPTVHGFRPDLVIEDNKGKKILVEIWATHTVDAAKKEMAKEHGLPMVEIDVGDFMDELPSQNELRNTLIHDVYCKKWVVRPEEEQALSWGQKYYAQDPAFKQLEKEREAKRRREELKNPENYRTAIKKLEKQGGATVKGLWFYKKEQTIPFFVNIPISGEYIFQCDRRVWQGSIFDHFIYNRNGNKKSVYPDNIVKWVNVYQKNFSLNDELAAGSGLLEAIVKKYLEYLEKLGFLVKVDAFWLQYFLEHRQSIIPPDEEYANSLEKVLKNLGEKAYLPDVDGIIYENMEPYRIRKFNREQAWREKQRELEQRRQMEEEKKKQEEKEKEKAREEEKRRLAWEKVLNEDYEQNNYQVKDEYGTRYAKCVVCGKVYPTGKMKTYGGGTSVNKGTCENCRK